MSVAAGSSSGDGGTGQHPHRLSEAEAVAGREFLGGVELFHCALKPRSIDLHPLTAQQHEVLGAGEQGRDLDLGEWLAIQHDAHLEIQQPIQPDSRWRLATDGRGYLRSDRTAGTPGHGHAYNHPGAFKLGNTLEKTRRLRGSPAQRMKDIAGVDHRLQPGAMFRGALHRQEQGQQPVPVCRSGVFAQCLAEGNVLCLCLGGKASGVGRHEGEWLVGIAAVFRQIEMHPTDQVPRPIQGGQEGLQSDLSGGKRRGEGSLHLIPQRQQDILGQIFRARHNRRGQHQR